MDHRLLMLPNSWRMTVDRRFQAGALTCAMAALLTLGHTAAMAEDRGPGPKGSNQRIQYCRMQWLDCYENAEKDCGDLANPGPYCLADKIGSCNSAETRCLNRARAQGGAAGTVGNSGGVLEPAKPPAAGGLKGATPFAPKSGKGGTVSPSR